MVLAGCADGGEALQRAMAGMLAAADAVAARVEAASDEEREAVAGAAEGAGKAVLVETERLRGPWPAFELGFLDEAEEASDE